MAGLILLAISLAIYFIPSIVASNRNHKNVAAIVVLNLFLGWTVLGWVLALVWAVMSNQTNNKTDEQTDE
jgi:hypothetical protein